MSKPLSIRKMARAVCFLFLLLYVFTPHAQRERGKVIGVGDAYVYNNYYVCGPINFFNTINIPGRTSQTLGVGLLKH